MEFFVIFYAVGTLIAFIGIVSNTYYFYIKYPYTKWVLLPFWIITLLPYAMLYVLTIFSLAICLLFSKLIEILNPFFCVGKDRKLNPLEKLKGK